MKKSLLIVMCCFTTLLFSQQSPDTTKIYPVDEVIVTGTKTSVNRNQLPYTVSVVNQEDIQSGSETALLPVLSDEIPGLFITERGVTGFGVATGAAGQVTIRGIGANPTTGVLVLLNGNPQFMGLMGHPLSDAYRSSNVEKVEVVRGPASTLYGSNAMGGVINIITKDATKEGFSGQAGASYGSFYTLKYSINGAYKRKGFSIFTGLNHDQTDGHRNASFFKITDGYIRSSYEIGKHVKLSADFSLAYFNAADPGLDTSDVVVHGDTIDIQRGMGAFVLDNTFNKTNGSVRFFYNYGEHNITSGFFSNDNNYGIIAYQSVSMFSGNTITLGIDYKNYGGKAENLKFNRLLVDTSVFELAGYIMMQQELAKIVTINAGIRYEKNSIFGTQPIPTLGASVRAAQNTFVKASVAKGFRSPTIRELFMFNTANANLKPEKLINYEATLEQYFQNGKVKTELCLFLANGNNIIQVDNSGVVPKYSNSGTIKNKGIEVSIKTKLTNNITSLLNYSYIDMDNPLLATPRQKLNAGITYRIKPVSLNLTWQYIDKLYTITDINNKTISYNMLNARINYTINKYSEIYLKGENLLNSSYEVNFGYPMPGIMVFGGINFNL